MLFALPLGIVVIGLLSPPAAGTANTLRNAFALNATYATHRLSGDQARPRFDRVRLPVASDRSCLVATSTTRRSVPSRTKAIDFPSGDTLGAVSPTIALVNWVSVLAVKSNRNRLPTPLRSET